MLYYFEGWLPREHFQAPNSFYKACCRQKVSNKISISCWIYAKELHIIWSLCRTIFNLPYIINNMEQRKIDWVKSSSFLNYEVLVLVHYCLFVLGIGLTVSLFLLYYVVRDVKKLIVEMLQAARTQASTSSS